MSFDNTKYDIELNGVGHRINGYKKSESNPFVPRLGSGDQTESDFDLLRTKTLVNFKGGQLQRRLVDNTSVYGAEGVFPYYGDGVLYGAGAPSVSNTLMDGDVIIYANVQNARSLWVFYFDYSSNTNKMVRTDTTSGSLLTPVVITVPTKALTWSFVALALHNNQVWLSGSDGITANESMYYMAQNASTFTEVTGGTNIPLANMVSYKGSLYGTDFGLLTTNSSLYKYTGDTATRSYTLVGAVPNPVYDWGAKLFLYNNRICLSRMDGLWTYDTVLFSAIDDLTGSANPLNYRNACVLRGYIYFDHPDGFYRYNGSLIEKLYDTSMSGMPVDMIAQNGKLWRLFANSSYIGRGTGVNEQYVGSSDYDKAMGFDYSAGNNRQARVDVFDGLGMYTWGRTAVLTSVPSFPLQNLAQKILWFNDKLIVFLYGQSASRYYYTTTLPGINTDTAQIVTSIFDGDFPQIFKAMENVEIVLDGGTPTSTVFTVSYRTSGFNGTGSWTTFGTITLNGSTLLSAVADTIPAGLQFKQIQFRFQTTSFTSNTSGIAKIIMRYNLMPEVKYQWQFTVLAYGDSPGLEPLMLKDTTEDSQSVAALRGNIYSARDSKVPIIYCDIDGMATTTSHTNVITTITLDDTRLLKTAGYVKLENEIIKYTGKTTTTLTGCTRGALGTTAASHTSGAIAFPCYRVFLRQILNERVELADRSNDAVVGASETSEITVLIQEL
jgi:hypothetical protein